MLGHLWSGCGAISAIILAGFLASMILALLWSGQKYETTPADEWIMVGGVTSTSAQFRIRLSEDKTFALREVDRTNNDARGTVVYTQALTASTSPEDPSTWIVPISIENVLQPETKYCYELEIDRVEVENPTNGCFRTPATEGTRFDFSIAAAGCAMTGSTNEVFDYIAEEEVLFMLHLGDFHYEDIGTDDLGKRLDAVGTSLQSKQQRNMLGSTALVYMWDDHDWLGNDSGEDSEQEDGARDTALLSYQLAFPSHPLAVLDGSETSPSPVPTYHAFTIGTVRFIVSDLRSEANATHVYSGKQAQWLRTELLQAPKYDFVVWVTTKPWIGPFDSEKDDWRGTLLDREELSDIISSLGLSSPNILAVSADAHMIAFDNGRNTYYGTNGSDGLTPSFPILQTGPMDRTGSVKGGPFSDGCHTYTKEPTHQYSTLSFLSRKSGEYCIQIASYRVERGSKTIVLEQELCGPDIFTDSSLTSKDGTCKSPPLSPPTLGLSSVGAILTLVTTTISLALIKGLSVCTTISLTLLVWLGALATGAVGLGIPLAKGLGAYPSIEVTIIFAVQAILVQIVVGTWWCRSRKDDKQSS